MNGKICLALSILLISGCAAPDEGASDNFSHISAGLKERTNYTLRQDYKSRQFEIPDWVTLDDGLSQDEAVALALWNNAQFQADLAALGFARADLLEANMLSNPIFSILFPISPKLLETELDIPIDVLWQRPHRIAAAELDAKRLSENLIKNGLGLIRDVQITYTELLLAQERIILASTKAQLQIQINQLNQSRLRTGDISQLAVSASYVDMLRATDAIKRISEEADVLKQKFHSLLGIISEDLMFDIVPSQISPISAESVNDMLRTALICRPDLRAAELAIEAAGERIGWEESKVYNFIAVLDGDDTEEGSFTIRPGFSVEIPIFNQNDAKIEHAKAELEQAARRYEAVRQNIILEVKQAYTQYISAHEQFDLWKSDIIPSLEQVVEQTQKSYEAGEVSLISVLHAQKELAEASMYLTELVARLNSSTAELNYCIGRKMI